MGKRAEAQLHLNSDRSPEIDPGVWRREDTVTTRQDTATWVDIWGEKPPGSRQGPRSSGLELYPGMAHRAR